MAQPFDVKSLAFTGEAAPIAEGVGQMAGQTGRNRYVGVSVSENGVLAYHPSATLPIRRLVWVDRGGNEEPLAAEPRRYYGLRLSPDGQCLAIAVTDSGNTDVWIYDLERKTPSRLTFDPAADRFPLWTPDGQRVVFASGREGGQFNMFWKAADGTGLVERLTTSPNHQVPHSFSPDGKQLVFVERSQETRLDLRVLSMEGEPTSQPLLRTPFHEVYPVLSSDGQWMAYTSDETGQSEVYVRPFPNVEDGKQQISTDGGRSPVWGPKGRELFYCNLNGEVMMVVAIQTEPTFSAGSPRVLA